MKKPRPTRKIPGETTGERLRRWRLRQDPPGMSQTDLAELVGCSRQTISSLETDAFQARREHVLAGIERATAGNIKAVDWFACSSTSSQPSR